MVVAHPTTHPLIFVKVDKGRRQPPTQAPTSSIFKATLDCHLVRWIAQIGVSDDSSRSSSPHLTFSIELVPFCLSSKVSIELDKHASTKVKLLRYSNCLFVTLGIMIGK